MSTPLFISQVNGLRDNWREAFGQPNFSQGLPARFDRFDKSAIFVDFMQMSGELREPSIDRCVATGRPVLVLSPTPTASEAISVIKHGVTGYGHSLASPSRLREMLMVVEHGGLWVGNKLMKHVLAAVGHAHSTSRETARLQAQERLLKSLSAKEAAVAEHVSQGATNTEIAVALGVKERTVKAHITSIFEKFQVRNRVELALVLNGVPVGVSAIPNPSKQTAL